MKETRTIQLQSVRWPNPAKPLKDFKVGEKIMCNYGYIEEIISMQPTKTGKSYKVTVKSMTSGEVTTSTRRADTLFAIATEIKQTETTIKIEKKPRPVAEFRIPLPVSCPELPEKTYGICFKYSITDAEIEKAPKIGTLEEGTYISGTCWDDVPESRLIEVLNYIRENFRFDDVKIYCTREFETSQPIDEQEFAEIITNLENDGYQMTDNTMNYEQWETDERTCRIYYPAGMWVEHLIDDIPGQTEIGFEPDGISFRFDVKELQEQAEPEKAEAPQSETKQEEHPEKVVERNITIAETLGVNPENVKILSMSDPYDEKGLCYSAGFVEGKSYIIPRNCMKSAAASVAFTVERNTGKSVTIRVFEKYNGEITEKVYKNKKLNPGDVGLWLYYDADQKKFTHGYGMTDGEKERMLYFAYVECFDLEKVSRWTKGKAFVTSCTPCDISAFCADKGQSRTTEEQTERKTAADLDFTPCFYPVSEHLARLHKEAISFDDYKEGSVTREYQSEVTNVYELAKSSPDPEKALFIADCYSKRLARWYDDYNRNGASCPSWMITGGGNFPVRKKERQNARFDTLMQQYNRIQAMKDKIKHPHGYEIIRDTITADEFENILHFSVVINQEENRLQLVDFENNIPSEEQRTILKHHGFRWSPRFKAWQRQLTENAVSDTWTVVREFDKLENEELEKIVSETVKQAEESISEAPTRPTTAPECIEPETIPQEHEQSTEAMQKPENSVLETVKTTIKGSKCVLSAPSCKELESLINQYYYSHNYVIRQTSVYNTKTNKVLDDMFVVVTKSGRYQMRRKTAHNAHKGGTTSDSIDSVPSTNNTTKTPTAHGAPPGMISGLMAIRSRTCKPHKLTGMTTSDKLPRPPPTYRPRFRGQK